MKGKYRQSIQTTGIFKHDYENVYDNSNDNSKYHNDVKSDKKDNSRQTPRSRKKSKHPSGVGTVYRFDDAQMKFSIQKLQCVQKVFPLDS